MSQDKCEGKKNNNGNVPSCHKRPEESAAATASVGCCVKPFIPLIDIHGDLIYKLFNAKGRRAQVEISCGAHQLNKPVLHWELSASETTAGSLRHRRDDCSQEVSQDSVGCHWKRHASVGSSIFSIIGIVPRRSVVEGVWVEVVRFRGSVDGRSQRSWRSRRSRRSRVSRLTLITRLTNVLLAISGSTLFSSTSSTSQAHPTSVYPLCLFFAPFVERVFAHKVV